ncbi:MAG: YdcH family protein [Betaproteobacteria bacterium]|nr:YdcH family protein [Betaproteobacteria bacterium]MBI2961357.1 YdcH family protein [Betaproteobacteria bacterium]
MEGIDETLRIKAQARLSELLLEHRDLDLAIHRLADNPLHDQLALQRMKKRKLLLKDQISLLERQLDPDIPA